MLTKRFVLKKSAMNNAGSYPVYLRVSSYDPDAEKKETKVHWFTGFYANDEQFDQKGTNRFVEQRTVTKGAGRRKHEANELVEFSIKRKVDGNNEPVEMTNKAANDVLDNIMDAANQVYNDLVGMGRNFTGKDFMANMRSRLTIGSKSGDVKMTNDVTGDFLPLYLAVMDELKKDKRFKSAECFRGTVNSLSSYCGQRGIDIKQLDFDNIDFEFLKDYVTYSKKPHDVTYKGKDMVVKNDEGKKEVKEGKTYTKKGVKNSENTICARLCDIRTLWNIAKSRKIATPEKYPFGNDKECKISVGAHKDLGTKQGNYLALSEVRAISSIEIDDEALDINRHLFLFSFLAQGMNWKDMALLTKANIVKKSEKDAITGIRVDREVIEYYRSKTKKPIYVAITAELREQLDWFKEHSYLLGSHLLPIIAKDVAPSKLDEYLKGRRSRHNEALKEIASMAGLDGESVAALTIYTARHSWATINSARGASVEAIGAGLGHQDGGVRVTAGYIGKSVVVDESLSTFDLPKPINTK